MTRSTAFTDGDDLVRRQPAERVDAVAEDERDAAGPGRERDFERSVDRVAQRSAAWRGQFVQRLVHADEILGQLDGRLICEENVRSAA